MSGINDLLQEITAREQKTRIMTEDITAMNDELKKLENELVLTKTVTAKLDQEIICKKKVLQDKTNDLENSRNELRVWEDLLDEKNNELNREETELEQLQNLICQIREKFCDDINRFVDKNFTLSNGETMEKISKAFKSREDVHEKKAEISKLELEVSMLLTEIKSIENLQSIEIERLLLERDKLNNEALSLLDKMRPTDNYESPYQGVNHCNTEDGLPHYQGQFSQMQGQEYSTEGISFYNVGYEGDVNLEEETTGRFISENTYCQHDSQPYHRDFSYEYSQASCPRQTNSQTQKKLHRGFIPIANKSSQNLNNFKEFNNTN